MKLFESKRFKFDVYLLRYPPGAYIGWHRDPAPLGMEHWRCNVTIKRCARGGKFYSAKPGHREWWRVVIFCPSRTKHMVSRVREGTRYVLSIGWLKQKTVAQMVLERLRAQLVK